MTTWHVRVGFHASAALSEDAPFDLTEALADHSAVVSVERDNSGGEIALFIEDADSPLEAANLASSMISTAAEPIIGTISLTSFEVQTEESFDRELEKPIFPEVVGYAEIAEIAGVSRQRARQFADYAGFPPPVIVTATGPLRDKHAVKAWVERRNTRPGRPTKAA